MSEAVEVSPDRPIGRVAEMIELQEVIHLLDRAVAAEASSNFLCDAEYT